MSRKSKAEAEAKAKSRSESPAMQRLRDEAEARTRARAKGGVGAGAGIGSSAKATAKANSKVNSKSKEPKPLVKIPKGKIGRAVFFGSQAAGAVTAARAIKNARAKGDKLELVHGVLTAAVLAATALLAVRSSRPTHEIAQGEIVEPLMLTSDSGR